MPSSRCSRESVDVVLYLNSARLGGSVYCLRSETSHMSMLTSKTAVMSKLKDSTPNTPIQSR